MSKVPGLPAEVEEVDPRPFLSCHVYAPSGEVPSYYAAWPGRLGALEQISYRLKVEMEIEHWLRICLRLASPRSRPGIGTLFRSEFGDLDEGGIARTLRILRGLEALLLGGSPFYESIEETIKQSTSTAFQRVETLQLSAARIPAGFDGQPDWVIALPLLLIRAAVWSQTGRQQPYLWEAYSALRTQQAHERPGWLGEAGRRFLTFLVRFQSAPGQYTRETGDARFLVAARQVAESTKLDLEMVLTSLGVLAMAQDFRNRKLDPDWKGAPSQGPREEERKLVGRHAYEHGRTNFEPFWALVSRQSVGPLEECRRASTWSYSRWLGPAEEASAEEIEKALLSSAEVERFQQLVEDSHSGVSAFSFGRDYRSEVQKRRVIEAIKNVLDHPEMLEKIFTFNKIPVPDCLNDPGVEILMEIRLTDDVTAIDMVFRGLDPTKLGKQPDSAWGIYKMLFDTAVEKDLICWPTDSGDAGSRYCPTALVGRFLEVAHRLHPADCVSIPIRFGEDRSSFVHLPDVSAGERDHASREVQAAARYVSAWVLNQIMMQEVMRCQVALEDLNETEAGKFWKEAIDSAIEKNHFRVLLDDYLGDYLAEPKQVLLRQGLLDLLPPAVKLAPSSRQPPPDPGSEAHALLQAIEATGDRSLPVLLGIDIGGTFIKMRFFGLERDPKSGDDASRLAAIGRGFRVLTAGLALRLADHAEEKITDQEFRARLDTFVTRLSARIHAEAKELGLGPPVAIGVTWPGPVRRQRVQGRSGILVKLGLFRPETAQGDIKRIMEMNLVGRLEKRVFEVFEKGNATVSLINDGDAHALGILASEYLGRRMGSGAGGELGVVVKAGTGTAGALIRNGLPRPGLMEFGKILVNLAYKPEDFEFPAGLANKYCSSRTLPSLMQDCFPRSRSLNPPIESIEVGRLAELHLEIESEETGRARAVLHNMAWDAGKIVVAGILQKIAPELDVVALQGLSDDWSRAADTVKDKVIQYLALGEDALDDGGESLRKRIREYGEHRLRALFGVTKLVGALKELRPTAALASQAIAKLGIYVGDLLALIYFTHRMDYAVLGGGVLSQTSGRLATEAAVKQLNMYNEIEASWEERAGNFSIRFSHGRDSAKTEATAELPSGRLASAEASSGEDPGIVGAALAGALELLRQKRLDGLKQVIETVHGLALMEALEIKGSDVTSKGRQLVSLKAHALEADTVLNYLDQAAPRLGLVRTGKSTYTRWFAS